MKLGIGTVGNLLKKMHKLAMYCLLKSLFPDLL